MFYEYSLVLFGFMFVCDVISLQIFGGFVLDFILGFLMLLLFSTLVPTIRTLWSFGVEVRCHLFIFLNFWFEFGDFCAFLVGFKLF